MTPETDPYETFGSMIRFVFRKVWRRRYRDFADAFYIIAAIHYFGIFYGLWWMAAHHGLTQAINWHGIAFMCFVAVTYFLLGRLCKRKHESLNGKIRD